jgi:hypothetical protein
VPTLRFFDFTFSFSSFLFRFSAGVPHWWLGFCLAFDKLLGALLAVRLMTRPGLSLNLNTAE